MSNLAVQHLSLSFIEILLAALFPQKYSKCKNKYWNLRICGMLLEYVAYTLLRPSETSIRVYQPTC